MHACVISQLDISNRRISVLQTLLKDKQQPHEAQDIARLATERNAYMLVEVLSLVVLLILPIAALCDELSTSKRTRDTNGMHAKRPRDGLQRANTVYSAVALGLKHPQLRLTHQGIPPVEVMGVPMSKEMTAFAREKFYEGVRESMLASQQHRVQHGRKLIRSVWASLDVAGDCVSMRQQLHAGLKAARQALLELGAPVLEGPTGLVSRIFQAQGFVAAAGAVWVLLVCQLPHECTDPSLFSVHFLLQIIECQSVAIKADQPLHFMVMMLEAADCAQLCSGLKEVQPKDMRVMLCYFEEKAMPEAQELQLQMLELTTYGSGARTGQRHRQRQGDEDGKEKGGEKGDCQSQGQGQGRGEGEGEGEGDCQGKGQGQSAVPVPQISTFDIMLQALRTDRVDSAPADKPLASETDSCLDDMNALLQLMYGSST